LVRLYLSAPKHNTGKYVTGNSAFVVLRYKLNLPGSHYWGGRESKDVCLHLCPQLYLFIYICQVFIVQNQTNHKQIYLL